MGPTLHSFWFGDFCCTTFIVYIWSRAWVRGSGVLQGEAPAGALRPGGCQRGPLKGCWAAGALEAPGRAAGGAPTPERPTAGPRVVDLRRCPTGSPFADAFHLLLQEVAPREVLAAGVRPQNPGHEDPKRSGSGSSPESRWLPWTRGLACASWSSVRASWKTARRPAGFAPSGAAGGRARDLFLEDPREKWRARPSEPQPPGRQEAQREVSAGGLDAWGPGGGQQLLWNGSERSGSSWLRGSKDLSSK